MIRYSLKCDQGHGFDSWFANAGAYDALKAGGHLACAVCGSTAVDKALMAPGVATASEGEAPAPALAAQSEIERKLAELRAKIESQSQYVGGNFVREARAMHEGSAPERSIWGEAKPEEARALAEEGVPIMPLPFVPKSHTN